MRTFPDSLIRDIVRGEPLVRLALRGWQHPFRACTPTVRWHFQSMKKSKMQKHAAPSGQKRAGTQRSVARTPADFAEGMVQAYALNDRMNQLGMEHLDPRAWRAKHSVNGTRTEVAIFIMVQNVRCKW